MASECLGGRGNGGCVERLHHRAGSIKALGNTESKMTRNESWDFLIGQIKEAVAFVPLDLQQIAEAIGNKQSGAGNRSPQGWYCRPPWSHG